MNNIKTKKIYFLRIIKNQMNFIILMTKRKITKIINKNLAFMKKNLINKFI